MKYKILEFKNAKDQKIYRVKKKCLGIFWRYVRCQYSMELISPIREWESKESVCEWVQDNIDDDKKDKRIFLGETTCE